MKLLLPHSIHPAFPLKPFRLPIILLLLSLWHSPSTKAQTVSTVTIGPASGTNNQCGPTFLFSAGASTVYSRFAYLYTAAELGIPSGSKITKIEWQKADAATLTGSNTMNVWLSNNNLSSIISQDTSWNGLVNGATQTYSSSSFTITGAAGAFVPVPFNISGSDSFLYTGSNLQILTDFFKGGTASAGINWRWTTATGKSIGIASSTPISGSTSLVQNTYGNKRPTIRITYVTPPPCTGIPTPGTVVASSTAACAGVSFTLGISNTIAGGGVTYVWKRADNAAFTSNVTTVGSNATFTTSITATKYYKCIVSCSGSGLSDSTPVFTMNLNPAYMCICASSATSSSDEEIMSFSLGSYTNTSDCNTTAPGPGSVNLLYSNYQTQAPITVERGATYPIQLLIGTCQTYNGYNNQSAIYIDFNQNVSLSDAGEKVYTSSTNNFGTHTETGYITIPATANTGLMALRIINSQQYNSISSPCGSYSWGETEDYVINVVNPSACSGTPSPGASVCSNTNICLGTTTLIQVSNMAMGSGITYQWYNGSGIIAGATSASLVTPPVTAPDSFYCKVTCSNSGLFAYTPATYVTIKSYLDCYCTSAAGGQDDEDIKGVTLNGATNNSNCTTVAPGAGSFLNRYSNFKTLGSLTTVTKGGTYPFSVVVDDCDDPPPPYFSFGMAIWIDFNHNASFD
ncbi:MAG TPA: GEVED domain-containing protein, partial [Chitinophagaceae bacterium]|nr:GEVED domain-containing protein [Chitinophagaceae bacterium]